MLPRWSVRCWRRSGRRRPRPSSPSPRTRSNTANRPSR
ncbi:Uncharacterised protein [Bordetella pertussis]|nr:Uncharacterised protein [Bordetella pertussis]